MARLRRAISYRRLERPYTRFSKYRQKNYVRSRPVCKVVRFDMGDPKKTYEHKLNLVTKTDLQIRDNAIESARQTSNRYLENTLGKGNYHLQVRIYPHHVLRENPLASGAGADRMSTGMAHSFGKVIGIAAQVHAGQPLATLFINKGQLTTARLALKRFGKKMPCGCAIVDATKKPKQAPKPASKPE